MGLKDIESTLPPGFRFYPSDEELVCHYLHKKVTNERFAGGTLVEVDLHIHEPWELPEVAKLNANEWYFFSFRDRKYATGLRTNRATKSGYWKATGKDRVIYNPKNRAIVGMRKTLVFYQGRAPNGIKTNWVMHEFRMENPHTPPKEDWVLCRVFQKKKSDSADHSQGENEQEIMNNNVNGCSSSHRPDNSPPAFPALMDQSTMSAGYNLQMHSPNDFFNVALMHYNASEFQMLEKNTGFIENGISDGGGCSGMLLDIGLEEQYDHSFEEM